MTPIDHPAYGPLHTLEVYLDWDGPKLLAAVDDVGNFHVLHWIDDAPGHDRWWVTRVARKRLDRVRAGSMDFAHLVREPVDTLFMLEDAPGGVVSTPFQRYQVDEALLPQPGDRLRCTKDLDALLQDHARRRLAARLGEDILDFQLQGAAVDDHRVTFPVLARFLNRTNDFLKALSVENHTSYDAQVHATPAGSFMVRVSGGNFSLAYATHATARAATGEHAQIRAALPSEPSRSAFLKFIEALIDEQLGVSIHRADPGGASDSVVLSNTRIVELRKYFNTTVPLSTEDVISGILDTISDSMRRLSILTTDNISVDIEVPKELIGAIAGLQARRRYECKVARHAMVNLFKDEQEVEFQLVATPKPLSSRLPDPPDLHAGDQQAPIPPYDPTKVVRRWAKRVTRTDAHETLPSGFPYLRMSSGINQIGPDAFHFFYNQLFGTAAQWQQRKWGKRSTSVGNTGHVEAFIQVLDLPPFRKMLKVSVDPHRQQPAWIHWDDALKQLLRSADLSGQWVSVERTSNDEFWIRFQPKQPTWYGKPQPS